MSDARRSDSIHGNLPSTFLVGTGVVGRAILDAHIAAKVSVCISDQNTASLEQAIEQLDIGSDWQVQRTDIDDGNIPIIALRRDVNSDATSTPATIVPATIIIESIAERLDVKQNFFQAAERVFGDDAILCSNTSTLRIGSIADGMSHPQRVCGMHFFMPVDQRPAVEIVRAATTSQRTIETCQEHVRRINKSPLVVADSPGFIVNRLLSPYLNQSLLLLGHGVSAEQIERAATEYGMPLSPLELIDWIGTRTMFDAGRAFWQAFPGRIDPSPIVPALIKQKRAGRASGGGLYDYQHQQRSERLSPVAINVIQTYESDPLELTDNDVLSLLAIPMWIEAALALSEGVARSCEQVELAMHGGLGYQHPVGWLGFFDQLGSESMARSIRQWSPTFKSMQAPPSLLDALDQTEASATLGRCIAD